MDLYINPPLNPPNREDWERYRPAILAQYQDSPSQKGKTLEETRQYMQLEFQFCATGRMFKQRFAEWDVTKYSKAAEKRRLKTFHHHRHHSNSLNIPIPSAATQHRARARAQTRASPRQMPRSAPAGHHHQHYQQQSLPEEFTWLHSHRTPTSTWSHVPLPVTPVQQPLTEPSTPTSLLTIHTPSTEVYSPREVEQPIFAYSPEPEDLAWLSSTTATGQDTQFSMADGEVSVAGYTMFPNGAGVDYQQQQQQQQAWQAQGAFPEQQVNTTLPVHVFFVDDQDHDGGVWLLADEASHYGTRIAGEESKVYCEQCGSVVQVAGFT